MKEDGLDLAKWFEIYLQSLTVSGETRDAHQTMVVNFEDSLEVAVNGHQLS